MAATYRLDVESYISAAHQLRGYRGKCENLHGHNWRVKLSVCGDELDEIGMLMDFTLLKALLDEHGGRLDHTCLNDVPPFDEINPTSELMAKYLAESIEADLPERVRVESVTVWESERCSATYRP